MVAFDGEQPGQRFDCPRDPAWILQLLVERQRFNRVRTRRLEVLTNNPDSRSDEQADSKPPNLAGAAIQVVRSVAQLLRSIDLAAQHGEVAEDQGGAQPRTVRWPERRHMPQRRGQRRSRACPAPLPRAPVENKAKTVAQVSPSARANGSASAPRSPTLRKTALEVGHMGQPD